MNKSAVDLDFLRWRDPATERPQTFALCQVIVDYGSDGRDGRDGRGSYVAFVGFGELWFAPGSSTAIQGRVIRWRPQPPA